MASYAPPRPPMRQQKQETHTSQQRCATQVCGPGLWETQKLRASSACPNVTGREHADRRCSERNESRGLAEESAEAREKRAETL